uniref:5-formyltetrahydrofolate cyclo-ligase n=1 Tax=Timema douglasi TaxID=61478 RepID=A0A7R8ZA21_TIMDO|nr:unnamed protein product [Timema douglasi]
MLHLQLVYSSPMASLVLTDSSQLTSDSQNLGEGYPHCCFYCLSLSHLKSRSFDLLLKLPGLELLLESPGLDLLFKSPGLEQLLKFRKGSSEMEMIRLFSMEDLNKLPVNKWNIRQPLDDEIRESVFEAGLVFTPDGKRLGRGKAYYDQFLHKCSKQLKNSPVTLALAFKEQILPHLPTTPTDYIMDYVLYEDWG